MFARNRLVGIQVLVDGLDMGGVLMQVPALERRNFDSR